MPLFADSAHNRAWQTIIDFLPRSSLSSIALVARAWHTRVRELCHPKGYLSVSEAFDKAAQAYPEKTYILYKELSLSYQETKARVDALAQQLLKLALLPESKVGVHLPNSPALPIAFLAILKAGLVYVPLAFDTTVPQERNITCFSEIQASVLIFSDASETSELVMHARTHEATLIMLHDDGTGTQEAQIPVAEWLGFPGTVPTQLAYIVHSSGSTGAPKAIQIEHKGIMIMHQDMVSRVKLTPESCHFQCASITFDAHIMEILLPFSHSDAISSLVIMPRECDGTIAIEKIADEANRQGVTHAIFTASLLTRFSPSDFITLRTIVSTGERLYENVFHRWGNAEGFAILNGYGPAEVTIGSTTGVCIPGKPIDTGPAFDGLAIELAPWSGDTALDTTTQTEVIISGYGLARGYTDPTLTQKKFHWSIFEPGVRQRRFYLTGDLGSFTDEGGLVITGRTDNQIKVHGKLIAPEEIDAVIKRVCPGIECLTTSVKHRDGTPHLLTFLVTDETVDTMQLANTIASKISPVFVPTYWYTLPSERMNDLLSANKKMHKAKCFVLVRELELSACIHSGVSLSFPQGGIETKISRLWYALLIEPCEFSLQSYTQTSTSSEMDFFRDTDFFHLGGTSLLMLDMLKEIYSEFSIPVEKQLALKQGFLRSQT